MAMSQQVQQPQQPQQRQYPQQRQQQSRRQQQRAVQCSALRGWRPAQRSHATAAAAAAAAGPAGGAPLLSFQRLPDAPGAPVVAERRAADVAVLGGGAAAVLAAYSLARSGRKVLLLPDCGLDAAPPPPRPAQPLRLPDPDALLVHLASEAAAFWRGLEALGGRPLLARRQSCDVVLDPESDHAGAAGFARLQAACEAASVPASLLAAAEAVAAFPQLALPPGRRSAALLQPEGGVIDAPAAAAVARQLAASAGVVLRDSLVLRGWRDRSGSCFQLRASSRMTPDLVSLFEAEVLLLMPGHWHAACLDLFGLQVAGLQARELARCSVPASSAELLQQLPVLQSWGAAPSPDAQPGADNGTALVLPGSGGLVLQQLPAWGQRVPDAWAWQPAALDQQASALHAAAAGLVRGLGPLDAPGAARSSSLATCSPDGRPLAGAHPGFDAGRVLVACGALGAEPWGPGSASSCFQLAPVLAKLGADLARGGGADPAVLAAVALSRDALCAASTLAGLDSWEGLAARQRAPALGGDEAEAAAAEAAAAR